MNLFDLTGKKAIVTGAKRGLGRGMAEAIHSAGAEVVLFDVLDATDTAEEIMRSGGAPVYSVQVNLMDREDTERAFQKAMELLGGKLDILFNNAGTTARYHSYDLKLEDWDRVMEVNLTAAFHLSQLAAYEMRKNQYGKIINTASMTSFFGAPNHCAYSCSKGAIKSMTQSLAIDWGRDGIRVNAIAPGYFETELNSNFPDARRPLITARIPLGSWGEPSDLAGAAIFLAAPASDYITGIPIPVDGGFMTN